MNQDTLDYALKETAEAVRIMFRDRTTAHAFDLGRTSDQVELVMILAIVTKEQANKIPWIASRQETI